jgi:hypothetical protein
MRYINSAFAVCFLIVFSGCLALGQATRVYKVGQTIAIEIQYEGGVASRIHNAEAYMDLPTSEVINGQKNLNAQMRFSDPVPSAENSIRISHLVTINDASGNYKLTQVRLAVDVSSPAWFMYRDEKLPEFRVIIDNPERQEPPTLKGVRDVSPR